MLAHHVRGTSAGVETKLSGPISAKSLWNRFQSAIAYKTTQIIYERMSRRRYLCESSCRGHSSAEQMFSFDSFCGKSTSSFRGTQDTRRQQEYANVSLEKWTPCWFWQSRIWISVFLRGYACVPMLGITGMRSLFGVGGLVNVEISEWRIYL